MWPWSAGTAAVSTLPAAAPARRDRQSHARAPLYKAARRTIPFLDIKNVEMNKVTRSFNAPIFSASGSSSWFDDRRVQGLRLAHLLLKPATRRILPLIRLIPRGAHRLCRLDGVEQRCAQLRA